MNHLLRVLLVALLALAPCRAAVSILIQPGAAPGTTVFTVTQTAPGPVVDVTGIVGYSLGMSLPTGMFNIPGLDPGNSSDIFGDLESPVGTITEAFSGDFFELTKLRISADPGLDSLLGFDRMFTLPAGASALRFEVGTLGPVDVNIALEALHQGIHVTEDPLFGTVTVTIVPESSTAALLLAAGLPWRRRRSGRLAASHR